MTKYIGNMCCLLLLVAMVSACSTRPSVHLYAKYLTASDTSALKKAINDSGYAVTVNKLAMPTSVSANTLLYSLMLSDSQTRDIVADIAADNGFVIKAEQVMMKGNHWYNKDSVALMLFPNDFNGSIFKQDIVGDYELTGCSHAMRLSLDEDGRFTLSGAAAESLSASLQAGTWHYRQAPILELRGNEGETAYSYFEISRLSTQDEISELTFTFLTPLQAIFLPEGCKFHTAIRN
ncbi:hypothetical protein [Alteromonas halophila]|uniref:Lipoprotein n=1 Tax=Alteromonas halophila TaxID=516698 RepID=A0A918JG62_9ALTE|nr:hypothetical protein [Alteromonas halophila]GGW76888.1 hypothetical protein GCM10007391_07190 [Alteromonas halophila]